MILKTAFPALLLTEKRTLVLTLIWTQLNMSGLNSDMIRVHINVNSDQWQRYPLVRRQFRADFVIESFWESAENRSQNQLESPTLTVTIFSLQGHEKPIKLDTLPPDGTIDCMQLGGYHHLCTRMFSQVL
jgi:hypothetical protein